MQSEPRRIFQINGECIRRVNAEKAIDKGLNIIGLTTDEDSRTHAKCATEIPSNTRRRKTDVNHYKKSITKRLYKLKKERCFLELNPKSISYFGRCFAYSIRQNKGNESKIRKAIEAIVPHAYGDHNKCNSDWCRYLRNPETFICRHLPAGKPLRNPSLKIELEKILGSFLSNEMIEKLAPCASTQANESFNSMVSYKCPKARHYSGSKSISYRVAATVCQKNEGYTYLENIASRLGIASRGVFKEYVKFRNRKSQQEKVRKSLRAVKLSRLTKRISSLMHEDRKVSKEGKTYESDMGLKTSTAPQSSSPLVTKLCEDEVRDSLVCLCSADIATYEDTASKTLIPRRPLLYLHEKRYINKPLLGVAYDLETTGFLTARCEITQLAATTFDGIHHYNCYILPNGTIEEQASQKTGLKVVNIGGERKLTKDGKVVGSMSWEIALAGFVGYLLGLARTNQSSVILLTAHNGELSDMPIILRYLKSTDTLYEKFETIPHLFADSKRLLKDRKERLQIPSSTDGKKEKFCFTLGGTYEHLFDDKFAAHDALEDVIALAKILSCNEVNLSSEDLLEFAIELKTALDYLNFLRGKKKYEQQYAAELPDVSSYMAGKLVENGVTVEVLLDVYKDFGIKGITGYLSRLSSDSKKVRITKSITAIAKVVLGIRHCLTVREHISS